jgi:hypothetical protein
MSVLEFISSMVHALAAPATLVILGLMFRAKIGAILQAVAKRTTHAKFMGAEIDLAEDLQEVESSATVLARALAVRSLSDSGSVDDQLRVERWTEGSPPLQSDASLEAKVTIVADGRVEEAGNRTAIEGLIRDSFELGKSAALSEEPTKLQITWTADGMPKVDLLKTVTKQITTFWRVRSLREDESSEVPD